MTKTPECDKLKALIDSGQRDTLQTFLDWLAKHEINLCHFQTTGRGRYDEYIPILKNSEQIMAEFFEIDLNKIEREKQAILDDFVKLHQQA